MNEKQLLELKEQIEEAKSRTSELNGKKSQLMQTLKKEWKCDSIAQANSRLKKLKEKLSSLETKIDDGLEQLESWYNDN